MVHKLEDLNDAKVKACDGAIGRVLNFLFDDRSWTVRYLVVGVSTWMVRHDVVIPVEAITHVDWQENSIDVQLTRSQLRASPDVNSRRPVSRQQEMAVRRFYGWPDYWYGGGFSTPARGKQDLPPASGDDPHLRGTDDITGYVVGRPTEEMGHVESFVMDNSSWHISYLIVKTGSWLYRRSLLIPTRWIESVSWSECRVFLRDALAAVSRAAAS